MTSVTTKIEGLDELAKKSSLLKRSFAQTTLRTALRNAAKPVRTKARQKAPRDRGDLVKGIDTRVKVERDGRGYADVGFKPEVFYGGFQELGTSQQPARPFLRPALSDSHRDGSILEGFVNALNRTISRILG